LFATLATLVFYLLLEFVLLAIGVIPASQLSDPTAGFSKHSRLFTESQTSESNAPTVETAKNRLDYFNYQSFPRDKAPGVYRVFCMGGSTTYGRPYNDKTSFSGFLRAFLPQMDSSRQWEVINTGGISYASYRIEILTRELTNYKPDLLVIYTGHNEFLEDRTYSSLIATPAPIKSVYSLASKSRTFSLMQRLVGDPAPAGDSRVLPEDVDALLDRSVGPSAYHRDEQWRTRVLESFRSTLERIVDLASEANAKVVFVTPACNLRDCAPFKSEHRAGLTTAELRKFMASFDAGKEALEDGNAGAALKHFDDALAIDEQYAAAYYFRGHALLELHEESAARDAFLRAREEDVCPLRALGSIQQIVQAVAADRKLTLIDFASIIQGKSEYGIPGADWFLDHVHPTIDGHELLARELANELVAQKIVSPSESWTSSRFTHISQQVKDQIDPREHAIALRNLAKVLSWAGKTDEADRLAEQAVEHLPDDEESQTMAGFAKLRLHEIAEAKAHFEAALRVQPDDVRALGGLGDVLTREGDLEAARKCFARAAAVDPKHAPAHFNLGNTLRSLGQLNEAASSYRRALALAPDQPDAHKNLGLVCFAQGDIDAAVRHFEKALSLENFSPVRHADLGYVLIDAGESQRAAAEFQAALAIDPSFVSAIFGLALLHERSGDLTRSAELLQDALNISPRDPNLHYNLARHALQLGDLVKAKRELDVVLELDPSHGDARRISAELSRQSP
jgi:tetratricopeptide (TPR) repeat protein